MSTNLPPESMGESQVASEATNLGAPNSDSESAMPTTWLHVHVPKAGGSTLRQLMNRNFGDGFYNSKSLLETKQYSCGDVSEIVRCHPWVTCFSDHKLSLDLPYDHEFSKIFALSYVRDPVERFISRYFFHRHFEEVNCIAQRMSFRDFANAELIEQEVHPQTNSQIFFLNGGRSNDDMALIKNSLETGKAFLFPIERFDESCIVLERKFPTFFSDLSYVRANVSKKDAEVTEAERDLAYRYLKLDYPVVELANQFLERMLDENFVSEDDRNSSLAEFKDRCSRRYHNFYPPVKPGEPNPPPDFKG
ncbi:MAG: sulfotransferase family 2 domain-containing protein [Planctomycetota bacterium]